MELVNSLSNQRLLSQQTQSSPFLEDPKEKKSRYKDPNYHKNYWKVNGGKYNKKKKEVYHSEKKIKPLFVLRELFGQEFKYPLCFYCQEKKISHNSNWYCGRKDCAKKLYLEKQYQEIHEQKGYWDHNYRIALQDLTRKKKRKNRKEINRDYYLKNRKITSKKSKNTSKKYLWKNSLKSYPLDKKIYQLDTGCHHKDNYQSNTVDIRFPANKTNLKNDKTLWVMVERLGWDRPDIRMLITKKDPKCPAHGGYLKRQEPIPIEGLRKEGNGAFGVRLGVGIKVRGRTWYDYCLDGDYLRKNYPEGMIELIITTFESFCKEEGLMYTKSNGGDKLFIRSLERLEFTKVCILYKGKFYPFGDFLGDSRFVSLGREDYEYFLEKKKILYVTGFNHLWVVLKKKLNLYPQKWVNEINEKSLQKKQSANSQTLLRKTTEPVDFFQKDIGNKHPFPPKLSPGQIFTDCLKILKKTKLTNKGKMQIPWRVDSTDQNGWNRSIYFECYQKNQEKALDKLEIGTAWMLNIKQGNYCQFFHSF